MKYELVLKVITLSLVFFILSGSLVLLIVLLFLKSVVLSYCVNDLFSQLECRETHTDYEISQPDIEDFYKHSPKKGNYINYLNYVCKKTQSFIKRPELLKLINRTIVFDIDDTLLYTRPFLTKKSTKVLLQPLKPVVDLLKFCKKVGYKVIVITARPPESIDLIKRNLKKINVKYDALFTSLYLNQHYSFKAVMRKNLEYITPDDLKTLSSKELFNLKKPIIHKCFNLKLVLSVGDKWPDVDNSKNILGFKLPEETDMNSYFIFNKNIRRIE